MYNLTTWLKEQRISSWSEINIEVFRTETGTRKVLLLTMVALNGLKHNAYRNTIVNEISGDDLFRPALP
jgi:hypothetical protein